MEVHARPILGFREHAAENRRGTFLVAQGQAFNAGDASAIIQLYASDAVLLLKGETFNGRGPIEAFHKGNFEKARYSCTWTIDSVSMVDNLAAVWGEDACVETPTSGAPSQSWRGRWLTVYQLQPDGSWLIVRDSGEEAK